MVYEDLVFQYNKLTEDEKNALLVYKSRLGVLMNSLDQDANNDSMYSIYEEYKKLLDNPKNIFLKFTVFKDISFTDINSFIDSLRNIYLKVEDVSSKLRLSDDITLYRAVSIKKNEELNELSRSTLISTSTDISVCSSFLISDQGKNYKHYLYQINLEKDSLVTICPYSILLNGKDGHLILSAKNNQKEVILSKNNYGFISSLTTVTELENDQELNIIIVDAKSKINTNKNTNKK